MKIKRLFGRTPLLFTGILVIACVLLTSLTINNLFSWGSFNAKGKLENPRLVEQKTWIKRKTKLVKENLPQVSEYKNLIIENRMLKPISAEFTEKLKISKSRLMYPSTVPFPNFYFKDNHTENIRYIDKAHGLFSNSIMSLLEDDLGYIWIASENDGLVKTNGKYSWNFTKKNGLKSNSVIRLFNDTKGIIWICWDKGLSFLKDNKLTTIENKILNKATVSRIREGKDGAIWIGTEENGLVKLSNGKLEIFNEKRGISSNNISDVAFDKSNTLVISCVTGGVNFVKNNVVTLVKDLEPNVFEFSPISLYQSKDRLWIGSFAGSQFYWQDNKMFKVKFSQSFERCFDIQENEFGTWFADYSSGMQLLKHDGTIHSFNKSSGLVDRNAFFFIIDKNKNVWVADPFFGLSVISISPFREKKDIGNYSLKMIESSNGDLLSAHNGLGITRIRNNEFQLLNIKQGKNIYTVDHSWDIEEDTNASYWVSTHGLGIARLDERNFNLLFFDKGTKIMDIERGIGNDFWFSTESFGIRKWSSVDNSFRIFDTQDKLSSNRIRSSHLDHLNRLWVCTNNGIDVIWGDKIAHINKKNGLSSNDINRVIEDNFNRYWIATNESGVNLVVDNEIIVFDQSTGLIDNRVLAIFPVSKNENWAITTSGLTRIKETSKMKFELENFDLRYGSFMTDFTGAAFQKEKGKIMFFTKTGYVEYDPYYLMEGSFTSNWKIESVEVNNKKVETLDDKYSIFKTDTLFIESSLLQWNFKEDVSCFYAFKKKDSKDTLWIENGKNEIIQPINFSVGEYELLYRVLSNGNSEVFAGPIFIVLNPWYNSTWFYFLISCLLLLLIYGFIRWRLRSLENKKEQLEKIVQERTMELELEKNELALAYEEIENQSNEKDVIIYEIHHRVKNNLQTITTLLDMQLRRLTNHESASILKDTIRRISAMSTSHNLLYSSDDLSQINIDRFLHELIASHEIFMFDKSSNFIIDYEIESFYLTMTDCISVGMIVSEVISNSIKHAFVNIENPRILIEAKKVNSTCIISVSDNGIGINEDLLNDKLNGLGVRLIRIFATKLKGEIEIKRLDPGTIVKVTFNIEIK